MSLGRWSSLSGKKMKARLKSERVAETFTILMENFNKDKQVITIIQ